MCCLLSESREILLEETGESPEILIDVYQLEQQQQAEQPQLESMEEKSEHGRLLSYCRALKPPQNWTNLGITLCILYNLFIVLILLATYVHFKMTN